MGDGTASGQGKPDVSMDREPASRVKRLLPYALILVAVLLIAGSLYTARDQVFGSAGKSSTTSNETPPAKTGDPNAVAEADKPLARVVQPPERTMMKLAPKADLADARFAVTFQPYGLGPTSGTVVVKVDTAQAQSGSAAAEEFAKALVGRNAVASVSKGSELPATGGSYTGVIALQRQGDASVLVLSEIQPGGGK